MQSLCHSLMLHAVTGPVNQSVDGYLENRVTEYGRVM